MPNGFQNDVLFAQNVDFTNTFASTGKATAQVTSDGQLLMGSTIAPNIRVNTLTAGPGITITNGAGTITISSAGGSVNIDSIAVQTGISPAVPDNAGLLTFNGGTVSAGTNPVRTNGTGLNTMALQVQISQAIAATDATKIGLANFNSTQFSVDVNGFVSATGTIPIQFTSDSGTAVPAAGNINILGGPGVTTSASGSTITINSVVFTDVTAQLLVVDNGYFATAAGAYTLPAVPAQGEEVIVFCDTAGAVAVTANTGQKIRIGSSISSIAGTLTSTAIGDCLTLRYRTTGTTWMAVSSMGNWTVA